MTVSENNQNQFIALIYSAIDGIDSEILKAKNNSEAVDGLTQLQFIKSKLEYLKDELNQNNTKTKSHEKLGLARFVVDTWPLNHPLGDQICEIEYQYDRLINKKVKKSKSLKFK